MVNGDSGSPKNTPAPWVPYTRAGCDFGATALANIVLENTGTGPNGDMTKVFGAGSPEWLEAQAAERSPPGPPRATSRRPTSSASRSTAPAGGGICAGNANATARPAPDEPGGYNGYQGPVRGEVRQPGDHRRQRRRERPRRQRRSRDPFGQPGFPGFDGLFATTTLGYVAQMQEAGIPVTFGYISDAHDQHGVAGEIHVDARARRGRLRRSS